MATDENLAKQLVDSHVKMFVAVSAMLEPARAAVALGQFEQLSNLHRVEEGDRINAILAFFHIYEMAMQISPTSSGSSVRQHRRTAHQGG